MKFFFECRDLHAGGVVGKEAQLRTGALRKHSALPRQEAERNRIEQLRTAPEGKIQIRGFRFQF